MIKRKITVTITDDRTNEEKRFEIHTDRFFIEFDMVAILADIAKRIHNFDNYHVRTRMDELPDSDKPFA